jgi:ubiquinone/menaquinone biosynthesis C-methylase UbiE
MTATTENTSADLSPSVRMIEMVTSFWLCRAIYLAASLGICDLLKNESRKLEDLAEVTRTHARSLYRVLRALASAGILTEDQQGRFALTPLGATLRTDVPGSLNAWVRVQLGEEHYRAWSDPLHSVQTGEIAFDHVFGMGIWKYRAENAEHAKLFDEAMANLTGIYNRTVLSSYSFSRFQRIIDVGGGDGGLLVAILNANPKVTGVLVDMPHVAEKARKRISTAGLMDRCEVVAGDAFNSVPESGDAYILSRVVHDWDDSRSIVLLKNCHRAMTANGRLLLIEGVIAPGNEPSITKYFDLNMMILNGGCERTAEDYQALFQVAGFKLVGITPTQSAMSILEAEKA